MKPGFGRSASVASRLKAATVPARIPEILPGPNTGFRRQARARSGSRGVILHAKLPPIGSAAAEAAAAEVCGLDACNLDSSDSSSALAEAAAALSPRSLCAQHAALQKDNRRLRREVASLRGLAAHGQGLLAGAGGCVDPCLLFLYASPLCAAWNGKCLKLLPSLDAENEKERIQGVLGRACTVEAEVASALSLRRAVQRKGAWLHVCAHNVEVAPDKWCLMLEDQGTNPVAMKFTPEELEALLLANGKATSSFVFLAICHSSRYREAFRKAGFEHIIDCESAVQDKHATQFSHDFYAALADGQCLANAFSIACTCAKARGDTAAYHLEGDGQVQLLPAGQRARATSASSVAAPAPHNLRWPPDTEAQLPSPPSLQREITRLPREPEDFVGRVPQMCEVFMALQHRMVVVLHSEAPYGRTATLQQIGQYANRNGRHFAGRCAFFPAKPPAGGLLIVDDADEVLAAGQRSELLSHLHSHRGSRLLLACREPLYDTFLDCGIKPQNVPLPPLRHQEAAELFLRSTYRPLTSADCSPCDSVRSGHESPFRIIPKAEALTSLQDGIGVFVGEPGKVRRAGLSVRPGSPPLDLPKLVSG